jgi:hypothetical protein
MISLRTSPTPAANLELGTPMSLWQRLLLLFTVSSHDELVRQLQFAVVENQILRGKLPKRIAVTPQERRRLLRFGKPLGDAIRQLLTIVSPDTFLRWVRQENHGTAPAKIGRPRIAEDLRSLVIRLALENPTWGHKGILGELDKLGLASICRETVRNILKAEGSNPRQSAAKAPGTILSNARPRPFGPATSSRRRSSPCAAPSIASCSFSSTSRAVAFMSPA